ncbi:MAG: spermidine/putrescine ABC transporter substrate-binding protein [Bacteroidetes bacterium]|nr:spermidine/putrescine ABC transporter substrate-binding protein [Bacteroidota bacterium]MCH8523779.1 spermidine/putrescine ABC transporter substrate-binding protein [Balneolales bacterium]
MIRFRSLILVVIAALITASCGGSGTTPAGDNERTPRLNFYNWSYYIADETIPDFEREFGVRVRYDNFSSNSELLAKLQAGASGYDLAVPSDYMVQIMINLELLQPLRTENIPNLENIQSRFRNLPFDPDNRYSIPYQWGTTGIAINTRFVTEEVDSWGVFWDERYRGRISILDDMRSGLVPALKLLGYSVNTRDEAELREARDLMFEQKPLVRTYSSETYMDLLKSGDIWIAQGWSGDIYQVTRENPDVIFIIPKEGSYVWVDNLVIPKGAPNRTTAEAFINYLLRPQVSAAISNYTGYSSPNRAALPLINPDLLADTSMYPPDDVMDRLEFLEDVGQATLLYNRMWNEVKAR